MRWFRGFHLSTVLAAHHVVPHALGQLLVALDGEVEAVVGEEGHVDLPVLLRHSQEGRSASPC